MRAVIFGHIGGQIAAYGADWLYLLVPVGVIVAVCTYLVATGRGEGAGPIARIGTSLERVTHLPAWSASGLGLGLGALVIAVIGFMWDVGWHIDFGRDQFLLTPPHMMIVAGLGLLVVGAGASTLYATRTGARTGVTLLGFRVPYGALVLGALGTGALIGFPLDEVWHGAYGVDVTMWGPTHLLMIAGASFSPLALWLLVSEARPERSRFVGWARSALAGAVLVGLSTLQGEFDFGVPQFQQLYHPVLIALAASIGLTAARIALGRGGALKAILTFIVLRGILAALVGGVFGLTTPHFPLYLGAALAVELTAELIERRALVGSLLAGLVIGIVGVGTEWAWTHVWGWHPWTATLFPGILLALVAAIAGVPIGTAIGRVLSHRSVAAPRLVAVCGIAAVVALALPLPRNDAPFQGVLTTTPAGDGRVNVEVTLDPVEAAQEADWFEVLSWQGGSMQRSLLEEASPGTYVSAQAVPADGEWKSLVRLARKDIMVAAPIYMPADPEIGASGVPVEPRREFSFVRDTDLLLREAHAGPTWPSLVAYAAIAVVTAGWLAAFVFAFSRLNSGMSVAPVTSSVRRQAASARSA
jgi:hypothetical protein